MKISIVTVSYNAAETIGDTIESVLLQDYPDVEYIVVDGASIDGTMDVVHTYGKCIHQVVSEPDRGIYHAMNKGIALASGDVIAILNSDDTYAHEGVLTKMAELFETTGCDSCYADLLYVDKYDGSKIMRYWQSGDYLRERFLRGWMPPHPTFFVKAELYHKYGVFSEDLNRSADYELMLRMLYKHNRTAAYLPEITVKMKAGGVSNASLRNRFAANRQDRVAWRMNDLDSGRFTFLLKPLRKFNQYFVR